MRKLVVVLLVAVVGAAGTYVMAGRAAGPVIQIVRPEHYVGASSPVEVTVGAPGGILSSLDVVFEQNGQQVRVPSATKAPVAGTAPDSLTASASLDRTTVPALTPGPAKLIVTASRPVLYGLRQVESQVVRDVTVRLDPPRVSVLSTHHFVNVGGAEMVVYRATPADVWSGVQVGEAEYPGYPAAGAAIAGLAVADASVRVAFFALRYDEPATTPIRLIARDDAGNVARADFDFKVFPKPFKQSRIELDDKFLDRVVPSILASTHDVAPVGSMIEQFKVINGELRKKNAATIAALAAKTDRTMLWGGVAFHPFTNSAVESAFADQRTYFYKGAEVDRQVHLGFDLASYANTPIVAANRGRVLYADVLGIYGNCVIIDHGMGLQSLYAHLSSIGVKVGDMVEKEQPIGRSGMTGLAGGDHLHFTMLVNGRMINPVEWWDPHWIEDRVVRKIRAAQ